MLAVVGAHINAGEARRQRIEHNLEAGASEHAVSAKDLAGTEFRRERTQHRAVSRVEHNVEVRLARIGIEELPGRVDLRTEKVSWCDGLS